MSVFTLVQSIAAAQEGAGDGVNSPGIDQGGTIVGGASEAEGVERDNGYALGVRGRARPR